MNRWGLSAVLSLLAACGAGEDDAAVPAVADVERVEAALARHPCVGSLDRWERNYRFSRKQGLFFDGSIYPDIDVIELHLRRIGAVVIQPGRHVMPPAGSGDWPDSSPIQSIDGRFDIHKGSLTLSSCKSAA